jgi:hypothetical protein
MYIGVEQSSVDTFLNQGFADIQCLAESVAFGWVVPE